METLQRTSGGLRRALGGLACASALLLASCGSSGGGSYKNELRPPSPINVTAYVNDKSVSVSPARFGAGPIVVIVTNQSVKPQNVTIETNPLSTNAPTAAPQSTGPITPTGTGRMKLDVSRGVYTLKVGTASISPAQLTVGAKRASAQNQVLQP
jgi:hypothetical protein